MKPILLFCFLIAGLLLAANPARAQEYYEADLDHAEYYYLPDVDIYFHIPARQFIYFYEGRWVAAAHPPAWLRGYDFEHGRRILVGGERPYLHHDAHTERYRRHGNEHARNDGYGNGHNNYGNGGHAERNRHGNRHGSRH